MITKQQTFDKVACHLLTQNCRAESYNKMLCLYREFIDEHSYRSCAAGCLIDDKDYRPEWEGTGIELEAECDGELNKVTQYFISKGYDIHLVKDLQFVHDEYEPHEWPDKLSDVAKKHGLSPYIISFV